MGGYDSSGSDLLMSIGSIILGLGVIISLTKITDGLMIHQGIWIDHGSRNTILTISLIYRICYAILAGYITAKLAPSSPVVHGFILGLICTILGLLTTVSSWVPNPVSDNSYQIVLVLATLPSIWLGAKLASIGF